MNTLILPPSRIRVLPDLLVRKIAAGEVVERPASVVKELVENSLDAGATRVGVTIEEGGAQLLRITDDGVGMSPEELRLAVAPHATSKIVAEEDLFAISTLGFRGEALASISAVSKLRMVSRTRDSEEAFEICVSGEELASAQAAGSPPGTTVEVRDLFFNVPARRKFLRAVSTEVGHVNEQFTRFGLAYPAVSFELTNNRRMTYSLPATDVRTDRIAKFFGPELSAALLQVRREEAGLALEAYAALPAHSRATPQWQYIFVNGRYVRDRFIQHAVREAYRGLMEPNRHAVVFLFLTVDPAQIDVNVHPTKIEVRWADSNLIHSQVLSALREAFQHADLAPALRTAGARAAVNEEDQDRLRLEFAESLKATAPLAAGSPPAYGEVAMPPSDTSPFASARDSAARFENPLPDPPRGMGADPLDSWRKLYGHAENRSAFDGSSHPWRPGSPVGIAGEPPGNTAALDNGPSAATLGDRYPTSGSRHEGASLPRFRAIQMHNLYLVAETDEGIVIVDQHALHERVIYDQLKRRLAHGNLEPQRLLLPETIKVTARQAAALESHAPLMQRLGVEITPFGAGMVAVHTFPSLLKDTQVLPFMRDLIDFLDQPQAAPETETVIHRVLDMMACKAAVKAGDPLTLGEIESLMAQRHLVEKPSSCPHGRPTMLRLTKADLNRQFKRT